MSALIGAAQRVDHYEIAAYGTVRAMGEKLVMRKPPSSSSLRLFKKKKTQM